MWPRTNWLRSTPAYLPPSVIKQRISGLQLDDSGGGYHVKLSGRGERHPCGLIVILVRHGGSG